MHEERQRPYQGLYILLVSEKQLEVIHNLALLVIGCLSPKKIRRHKSLGQICIDSYTCYSTNKKKPTKQTNKQKKQLKVKFAISSCLTILRLCQRLCQPVPALILYCKGSHWMYWRELRKERSVRPSPVLVVDVLPFSH